MDGLCTRTERVIDDVPKLAVMAAIFLGVGRRDEVKNEHKDVCCGQGISVYFVEASTD